MMTQISGCDDAEKKMFNSGVESSDAGIWDAEALSDFFAQNFAGKWQVYAVRDEEYYRTMILEQQSERGGVRLLKDEGRIVGMFAYASEDETEIREPLILPGYEAEVERAVCELKCSDGRPVASDRKTSYHGAYPVSPCTSGRFKGSGGEFCRLFIRCDRPADQTEQQGVESTQCQRRDVPQCR